MNQGERHLCEWQYGKASDFFFLLMRLISKADKNNLKLLSCSYPEEVEAYRRFSHEDGYWQRLEREYLSSRH